MYKIIKAWDKLVEVYDFFYLKHDNAKKDNKIFSFFKCKKLNSVTTESRKNYS